VIRERKNPQMHFLAVIGCCFGLQADRLHVKRCRKSVSVYIQLGV